MTIFKKDNFRINTISKFGASVVPADSNEQCPFIDQPISAGLAIEKKSTFPETYYVICFVKYNKSDGSAEIEPVMNRVLDIDTSEFDVFKRLTKLAIDMVEIENKNFKNDYNE